MENLESVKFNGQNIDEVSNFVGRNARISIHTETRNCSAKHPEGFDYPYAEVEGPDGWVKLSMHKSITKDLQVF